MPHEQKKRPGFIQKLFGTGPAPGNTRVPGAYVASDPTRCVQCGVCGYNCPAGIAVREYARQGKIVDDPRCVQCGQCVEVCPRGTLRWEKPIEVQLVAMGFAEPFSGNGKARR